jgi:non-ribosomal peptide synthetase component F
MLLDMHHIVSDGISMSLLIRDWLRLYRGETLEPLTLQYKDFACWQNEAFGSGRMEEQERYWLAQFSRPAPKLSIRTDFPRSSQPQAEGDAVLREISIEQTNDLRALAALTGTTLYMVLLSAYSILLSRYSNQEDIVIGTPVAGRRHADLRQIIGMFINMLPMRVMPTGDLPYESYLSQVKETVLQGLEHQEYPFDELVRKLNAPRDYTRNPLFDASFALQNMEMTRLEADRLLIEPLPIRFHPAKFDLTLWADETGSSIRFTLEFRSQLFGRETAERMLEDFVSLLEFIAASPQTSLKDIELLNEEEQRIRTLRLVELERALEMEFDL